jgi:hypothetical protein
MLVAQKTQCRIEQQLMNDVIETWMEAVVADFEVLFHHLPGANW